MSEIAEPGQADQVEQDAVGEDLRLGVPVSDSFGTPVLHPSTETYVDTVGALRDEGFVMLIDLTAVDYLTYKAQRALPASINAERFELVSSFMNHNSGERVRVSLQLQAENPVAPTLFDLYPGSEAMEREVADMFGIEFDNHPDPSRILMPEDWVGHPLRKDYAVGRIPVQFKATSNRQGR